MRSRYIPLTQQRYCCCPTCIQMILLKRGIPLISQEDIGYDLGLTVPKKEKKILPKARTGKKPFKAGWGTQVGKSEKYSINRFFKKHKIPLKEEYFPLSKIDNVKKWIRDQIMKDNDIMVCYNYKKVYGTGHSCGHLSIIDTIIGDKVILIDPSPNSPKYRKIELSKLIKSIKYHGEEPRGGFWLISPNK